MKEPRHPACAGKAADSRAAFLVTNALVQFAALSPGSKSEGVLRDREDALLVELADVLRLQGLDQTDVIILDGLGATFGPEFAFVAVAIEQQARCCSAIYDILERCHDRANFWAE